jgi:hypothetical protein
MKRVQPADVLTDSQRDYKRIKLDLEALQYKRELAKAEIKRLETDMMTLTDKRDEHPETKAEEAAERLKEMRLSLPATLFRILVEEGDEKHGKLLSFNAAVCTGTEKGLARFFYVYMHFSKTGHHRLKMAACNPDIWSDSRSTYIEGVRRPITETYLSEAWQSALDLNDHDVSRALAALTIIGFEKKRDSVCHDLLAGIRLMDE